MQWVRVNLPFKCYRSERAFRSTRHVHVSLRNTDGKNSFAVSGDELKMGRANAAYDDTKFISQEAEWFLAGVLDGLAEGAYLMLASYQATLT